MMDPKSPKLLHDIADACGFIIEVTSDFTEVQYAADRLVRQSVERNLEILGEALRRLEKTDRETATRISDYRSIIGLRNRLVHVYDDIDNRQIWEIVQLFLPVLHREVLVLLSDAKRADSI